MGAEGLAATPTAVAIKAMTMVEKRIVWLGKKIRVNFGT